MRTVLSIKQHALPNLCASTSKIHGDDRARRVTAFLRVDPRVSFLMQHGRSRVQVSVSADTPARACVTPSSANSLVVTGPAGQWSRTHLMASARQSGGRERLVFFIDLHDDKQGVGWPTLASGSNG